ncbi:hypothetical protein X975_03444, partial [Stegodyphus mimosarum]
MMWIFKIICLLGFFLCLTAPGMYMLPHKNEEEPEIAKEVVIRPSPVVVVIPR